MSDLVPGARFPRLGDRSPLGGNEVAFRLASALVQDGVTRVTLVVPRAPGVLVRARAVARSAGVDVSAGWIRSASMTLRFSAPHPAAAPLPAARSDHAPRGWWLRFRLALGALASVGLRGQSR